MNERAEAAMDALFEVFRGEDNGDYVYVQENDRDRWVLDGITNLPLAVDKALAAADAVMFSDEAVERAAKAVHDLGNVTPWDERDEELRELYREDARAVIAALKAAD